MKQESSETPLTPKERYDAQMNQIAEERAEHRPNDEDQELDELASDADEIMERMETKEIDKTVGQTKEPVGPGPFSQAVDKVKPKGMEMNRDQFEKYKADKKAQKALQALKNAQNEHLKPAEQKQMNLLVAEFEAGKITDLVIIHLMKEKLKISENHIAAGKEVSGLQRRMLEQVAEVTNNLVKVKGAMETTDKMILDRQKEIENPVEEKESKVN